MRPRNSHALPSSSSRVSRKLRARQLGRRRRQQEEDEEEDEEKEKEEEKEKKKKKKQDDDPEAEAKKPGYVGRANFICEAEPLGFVLCFCLRPLSDCLRCKGDIYKGFRSCICAPCRCYNSMFGKEGTCWFVGVPCRIVGGFFRFLHKLYKAVACLVKIVEWIGRLGACAGGPIAWAVANPDQVAKIAWKIFRPILWPIIKYLMLLPFRILTYVLVKAPIKLVGHLICDVLCKPCVPEGPSGCVCFLPCSLLGVGCACPRCCAFGWPMKASERKWWLDYSPGDESKEDEGDEENDDEDGGDGDGGLDF